MQRSRVLTKREIDAKVEIKLETYIKTKEIEFKTALDMVRTLIDPALTKQISLTATAVAQLKAAGIPTGRLGSQATHLTELFTEIAARTDKLDKLLTKAEKLTDHHKKAVMFGTDGEQALLALRTKVDEAETQIAHDLWPMAKYQDLLTHL